MIELLMMIGPVVGAIGVACYLVFEVPDVQR